MKYKYLLIELTLNLFPALSHLCMMHPMTAGKGLPTPNMGNMEAELLLDSREFLLLEDQDITLDPQPLWKNTNQKRIPGMIATVYATSINQTLILGIGPIF